MHQSTEDECGEENGEIEGFIWLQPVLSRRPNKVNAHNATEGAQRTMHIIKAAALINFSDHYLYYLIN